MAYLPSISDCNPSRSIWIRVRAFPLNGFLKKEVVSMVSSVVGRCGGLTLISCLIDGPWSTRQGRGVDFHFIDNSSRHE